MKKYIIIMTMIIVANVSGIGSAVCNAQLGGAAPLPEIKKSTGPTLEETTKWITDKMASLPNFLTQDYENKHSQYLASFDNCEMVITHREISMNYHTQLDIHYVKLQDINIDRISISKYDKSSSLNIWSLGGLNNIKYYNIRDESAYGHPPLNPLTIDDSKSIFDNKITNSSLEKPPTKSSEFKHYIINNKRITTSFDYTYGHSIYFKDIEVAESMSNAFKHAIKLCLQKVADEKTAQPPKKKELF